MRRHGHTQRPQSTVMGRAKPQIPRSVFACPILFFVCCPRLDFLVSKSHLVPSNSTTCPRNTAKGPREARNLRTVATASPKPRMGCMVGCVAENVIPGAQPFYAVWPFLNGLQGRFGPKMAVFGPKNTDLGGHLPTWRLCPGAPWASFWLKTWVWQGHHLGSRMARVEQSPKRWNRVRPNTERRVACCCCCCCLLARFMGRGVL